jgi:serine/threonine-protein kinase
MPMPRAPDLAGSALDGRYELLELLGEGSFGRVYRGRDLRLGRAVAVKVIKPWWAEDDAWVGRFQREARLLARVNDPGVVRIYDFGEAEEGPYYVAELVEGESLSDRLRRGPLAPEDARAVAGELCAALGAAHREGVLHCDVKPANVLLGEDGRVRVGDFGVARLAEGTSQAPAATVAGTPLYMSPEQARGLPAGRPSRRGRSSSSACATCRIRRRRSRRACPGRCRRSSRRRWPRSRAGATPTDARWRVL